MHNKQVLEVGSGTGLSGIASSLLGSSLTVLTDLNYTLDNLRDNVVLNFPTTVQSRQQNHKKEVRTPVVRALDWTDSDSYLTPSDCMGGGSGVWDVVIGADVVWLEDLVEPLTNALRAHCSPDTLVLLSHQV